MGVPVSQMWTVASYVLKQKIQGRRRYPLVLMLEPLIPLQLGLRRLRQDPVPGACFETTTYAGRVLPRGR